MKTNYIFISLIFANLFLACSPNNSQNTGSKNKSFSEESLQKLYLTTFKGLGSHLFSQKSNKISVDNQTYGSFLAGFKGLLLYSDMDKAIEEYLASKNIKYQSNDFYDVKRFELLADNIPVFKTGEKRLKTWNFWRDGKQGFHHYNPSLIRWGYNNLIPSPEMMIQDKKAKDIYKVVFARFFRMMTESYLYLQKTGFEEEWKSYESKLSMKSFRALQYLDEKYQNVLSEYHQIEHGSHMSPSMAIGFWLRRGIDGTDKTFWKGLSKFMSIYDKKWFDKYNVLND